ncbi:MAG: ribosomal RNA small subunit methyltransferase A [Rickettsiales bacterium]|mgnify:CR=1 FL=1|jgi:16S rRNA (adenine1518-N6/adenine1519-N6)-dimethyltransferase|nr:ribosomal RNA small subunit methyltransferase A [Rickettsiales bacterium]
MSDLPTTYAFIKKYNLINDKTLGQNFIINESLTDKIVSGVDIKGKVVVEIGPGPGCLTRSILKHNPKELILLEKDHRFNDIYREFTEFFDQKITVINEDCLEVDFSKFGDEVILISNLPYNISTKIYTNLLTFYPNVKIMVLMFQKEVADRIVALPGDKLFARLSAITNIVGRARKLFLVKPTAFLPPPKIMSMIIKFERLDQTYEDIDLLKFKQVSQTMFSQKRKIIANSLKDGRFNIAQIDPIILSKRPHQLTINEIYQIYRSWYDKE